MGIDNPMMSRVSVLAMCACWAVAVADGQPAASRPAIKPVALPALNEGFLDHLRSAYADEAQVRAFLGEAEGESGEVVVESLVMEGLAAARPQFAAALRAYDEGRDAAVVDSTEELLAADDPYVAANSLYLRARALMSLGRVYETQALLETRLAARPDLVRYTRFGSALRLLEAACAAETLEVEAAKRALSEIEDDATPEPVAVALRQMQLELARRAAGTLDEVAELMDFSADRLALADTTARVQRRQAQVVDLLDKLIEQQEQQEQQSQGQRGKSAQGQPGSTPGQRSQAPADESRAKPAGQGDIGDLHAAPKVKPGESWGKLPEAERERILQNIRERYPSRYRQLVEQYYRSLAEEGGGG